MTTETLAVEKVKAKFLSGTQLARLGVQILNKHDLLLQCMTCGEVWATRVEPDGSLPFGYWHCPNRCNL